MKAENLNVQRSSKPHAYDIRIGRGSLSDVGKLAKRWLSAAVAKVVIVSNPTVFKLYGTETEKALRSSGFVVSRFLMRDGETHKNLKTAEAAIKHFSEVSLSRTDAVIALGGGVVGDLAGFAAAIHLRGIAYLQIPTTLVAMIDSSVGGKTGVNSAAGKNLIGAFHPPNGVLIDTATLETLPRRELTAGFCEAIKQGAIGSKALLQQTESLLDKHRLGETQGFIAHAELYPELARLISDQIAFKAKIVAGDEFESTARTDARSRKILNFGHTLAHALETVTDYKYFRHGEAVGYGIMFAAELSKNLALCSPNDVKLLNDVVHRAGSLPSLSKIDPNDVFAAFRSDKKNLSGSLQMVLIKGIGKPVILTESDIPRSTALAALKRLFKSN